jgi:hypothetical protein
MSVAMIGSYGLTSVPFVSSEVETKGVTCLDFARHKRV